MNLLYLSFISVYIARVRVSCKEKMKRMKKLMLIASILMLGIVSIVKAPGIGTITMSPAWPTMQASPADFETWVQGGGAAYELHVLLVMTEDCWKALSDDVQVYNDSTTVDIAKSAFSAITDNNENVPLSTTASYKVASLKDHLSYGLSIPLSSNEKIYYNLSHALYLTEPLTGLHQTFTVKVPTADPSKTRVLVYVMGSSADGSTDLDMKVPPTPAGFVVLEPATIAAVVTSLGAFGLYALHRKRKL